MNRKLRRRAIKGTAQAGISPIELARHEAVREREILERVIRDMNAASMIALRDKFGFGSKRLLRYHEALTEVWDGMCHGYLSADDVYKTILEETGIDLKKI